MLQPNQCNSMGFSSSVVDLYIYCLFSLLCKISHSACPPASNFKKKLQRRSKVQEDVTQHDDAWRSCSNWRETRVCGDGREARCQPHPTPPHPTPPHPIMRNMTRLWGCKRRTFLARPHPTPSETQKCEKHIFYHGKLWAVVHVAA